jgi:hypothetical protein
VAPDGALQESGDPFEPYRLLDAAGRLVAPVTAYLRDLQARGLPETTQRSYGMALLRWFRFLGAWWGDVFPDSSFGSRAACRPPAGPPPAAWRRNDVPGRYATV